MQCVRVYGFHAQTMNVCTCCLRSPESLLHSPWLTADPSYARVGVSYKLQRPHATRGFFCFITMGLISKVSTYLYPQVS